MDRCMHNDVDIPSRLIVGVTPVDAAAREHPSNRGAVSVPLLAPFISGSVKVISQNTESFMNLRFSQRAILVKALIRLVILRSVKEQ